jgi:hypothetical protein
VISFILPAGLTGKAAGVVVEDFLHELSDFLAFADP